MTPTSKPKTEQERSTLKAIAKIALEGNLIFADFVRFSNLDPRKWDKLKNINLLDVHHMMRTMEADSGSDQQIPESSTTAENVLPPAPAPDPTPAQPEISEPQEPQAIRAPKKVSSEEVKSFASTVMSLFAEVGEKRSKREIQEALSGTLNEDQVNAGLLELKTRGTLKPGRGRSAKWERLV